MQMQTTNDHFYKVNKHKMIALTQLETLEAMAFMYAQSEKKTGIEQKVTTTIRRERTLAKIQAAKKTQEVGIDIIV